MSEEDEMRCGGGGGVLRRAPTLSGRPAPQHPPHGPGPGYAAREVNVADCTQEKKNPQAIQTQCVEN